MTGVILTMLFLLAVLVLVAVAAQRVKLPPSILLVIAGIILAASWNFLRRHSTSVRNGLNGRKGTITSTKRTVNP